MTSFSSQKVVGIKKLAPIMGQSSGASRLFYPLLRSL
jgi:hypothetical protein